MKRYWSAWVVACLLVCLISGWSWGYDESGDRRVRQVLSSTIVSFSFEDQPVAEVVEYLGTLGDINVVLDHGKIEPGQTVTLKLKNVSMETAIKFVSESIGMKYVIRDGVVLISDEEGTKQEPMTRVYEVLDLVTETPDFAGPNFELGQLSGSGSGGTSTNQSPWTNTTTTGTEEQSATLQERTEALVELIKQVIEPGTWEEGGY